MKAFLRSQLDRIFAPLAKKADIDNLYHQLAALMEVKEIVGPRVPLGPLRGWALSPDAMIIVLRDIVGRETPRVIEFGSGASTIAIAAALRSIGAGSLLTIEHDAAFAAQLSERLRRHDLLERVAVQVVPMRKYEPRFDLPAFESYDLEELNFPFDVALVDGPIKASFGAAARCVPLEWCAARLGEGRAAYLDDAGRQGEQAVVAGIKAGWNAIEVQYVSTEKGLAVLTR